MMQTNQQRLDRAALIERIMREYPNVTITSDWGPDNYMVAHFPTPQGSIRDFIVANVSDFMYMKRCINQSAALSSAYDTQGGLDV